MTPKPEVLAVLEALTAAVQDEPIEMFLIFAIDEAVQTVANVAEERRALELLDVTRERIKSGQWRRQRREKVFQ